MTFQTYQDCINWLQSQLPVFDIQGKKAYNPSLDTISYLCEKLNHPHTKFKSIHIAGTNGKGSTASMLASILQEAGYKTGLYTSPHLISFTERIKIDGITISEDFILQTVNFLYPAIVSCPKKPTFFEITTAIAFAYFAHQKVDIAVIETGLGGRLDATNILQPELSIITRIHYDHMDILGNTLAQIAYEKAGIIKPKIPVLIGKRNPETDTVFIQVAQSQSSPIFFVPDSWVAVYQRANFTHAVHNVFYRGQCIYPDLEVGLLGKYQTENVATVCAAVDFLANHQWDIKDIHLYRGFRNISKNVNLMGRMQVIAQKPLIIADIAHNVEGIQAVIESLLPYGRIHAVIGILQDKDVKNMLAQFPANTEFYMITASSSRALDSQKLVFLAKELGYSAKAYSDIQSAVHEAKKQVQDNEVIYIGGSNYVVSQAIGQSLK